MLMMALVFSKIFLEISVMFFMFQMKIVQISCQNTMFVIVKGVVVLSYDNYQEKLIRLYVQMDVCGRMRGDRKGDAQAEGVDERS